MIRVNLQLLGGRGASAFRESSGKLIEDLLGKGRGTLNPLDASKYGGLLEAEGAIRGLKRERALIYEDIAASPVAAFQGNRHSVGMDAAALTATSSMTHNHPDARRGGTFSFQDISTHTMQDLRRSRAAGREGTYYLNATNKARPEAFNRRVAKDIPRLEKRMRKASDSVVKRFRNKEITEAQMRGMQRQVIVGELHKYYKRVAPQYGYVYGRQKLSTSYK